MDALILCAGLGTRLRPITDTVPKALVDVGGVPMLERIARRLVAAGADRIVVNVHHLADAIDDFLAATDLGAPVFVSREPDGPLGTGGGVARAAPLLRRDAPFFLHNVDIVTDADLGALWAAHAGSGALATLAVGRRDTPRTLLFDDDGLQGWENAATGATATARPARGTVRRWPFAGIHVVEPRLLDAFEESGAFSILDPYLRLVAGGERVLPWDLGEALWLEVGNVERLERARAVVAARAGVAGTAD